MAYFAFEEVVECLDVVGVELDGEAFEISEGFIVAYLRLDNLLAASSHKYLNLNVRIKKQ